MDHVPPVCHPYYAHTHSHQLVRLTSSHSRHADRTASLWLARLTDSSTAKRLNLLYLANEVVQQSRARGKPDFQLAFEPLLSDATALAYKNASQEVQGKIKRVVEVWRQRNIFDARIQEATEGRLGELDRVRGGGGGKVNGVGSGGGGRLGGSLFGGGGNVPAELEGVAKGLGSLGKADAGVKPAVDSANTEFAKLTDPNTPLPTPPVHAARLSALMKNLATAQGAVEASIAARKELLSGLEKLVESHRGKLAEDETTATDLGTRREGVEAKKREVEDGIMRGLSAPSSPEILTPNAAHSNGAVSTEIERPEAEGFTPPPPDVEAFTPPPAAAEQDEAESPATLVSGGEDGAAMIERSFTFTSGAENIYEQPPHLIEPVPAFEPPPALDSAAAADEFLNNLHVGVDVEQVRHASTEIPSPAAASSGDPRLKRRKLSHKASSGSGGGDMDPDIFGGQGSGMAEGLGVDEDGISALLGGR